VTHRSSSLSFKSLRLLAAGLLFVQTCVGEPPDFEWPDASSYWRVLVNVNQYIASRPPSWFSDDKLITDFRVTHITGADQSAGEQQYDKVRSLLESRGMYVGTYISGSTVMPVSERTTYPPAAVSLEDMPAKARYVGSWPRDPERKIVDLADADTRHAFQAAIKQQWVKFPAPVRFVDNAAVHPAVGREQDMADVKALEESSLPQQS